MFAVHIVKSVQPDPQSETVAEPREERMVPIAQDGPPVDEVATAVQLTPTQLKVMRGVHSGLLNKQIAFDLGIAEATVKAHMTALMRKLNVRNRTQVAIAAQALAKGVTIHGAA
jgi:DNA-binding NarL/FixJ family response regulator